MITLHDRREQQQDDSIAGEDLLIVNPAMETISLCSCARDGSKKVKMAKNLADERVQRETLYKSYFSQEI